MTTVVEHVKRARLYEEPNGSFAVDHTGTLGDFKEVPFVEGSLRLTLSKPTQSPMHLQQHIDGYPKEVFLPKEAKLDFAINIEGLTTRPTGAAAQGGLGRLLKIILGTETLQTGTTINDAAATTTSFVVTSAAGLIKGGAIGLATGAGGALEIREIKNISTNTVTLKHALSNAPSNSSTVWAAATYTLGSGDGDTATSAQMIVEGLEQDDRWLLIGGQIESLNMELTPGQIPKMTGTLKFANWLHGGDTSASLIGSALGTSTYTHNHTHVIKDSEFRVLENGTTSISNTLLQVPALSFAPNLSYVAHRTPAGTNTVYQWIRARTAPVISGQFSLTFDAETWWDRRDASAGYCVALQIGTSSSTGGVLITAPTVQVTDAQRIDLDGIAGQQVSWKGRLDEDITTATTDAHKSAFRIHIM